LAKRPFHPTPPIGGRRLPFLLPKITEASTRAETTIDLVKPEKAGLFTDANRSIDPRSFCLDLDHTPIVWLRRGAGGGYLEMANFFANYQKELWEYVFLSSFFSSPGVFLPLAECSLVTLPSEQEPHKYPPLFFFFFFFVVAGYLLRLHGPGGSSVRRFSNWAVGPYGLITFFFYDILRNGPRRDFQGAFPRDVFRRPSSDRLGSFPFSRQGSCRFFFSYPFPSGR